jgi:hypothetical protein
MDPKIHKLDDELIVVLPPDFLAQLGWGVGDLVAASRHEDGIKLTRTKTAYDHAMEIAKGAMDEYHDTLAALAKS